MNQSVQTNDELLEAAKKARAAAYAPYSEFAVGAALRCESGAVYVGCNVENVSFGLTLCAERVCVVSAVANGERSFEYLAIVSDSVEPVMPCGACRQVLAEFNPHLAISSHNLSGSTCSSSLNELLPRPRQGILG